MDKDGLIAELTANSHLRTPEEIRTFDKALEELSENSALESKDLSKLFMVFEDDCQDEEVMFGLVHFVEDFDLTDLLRTFIEVVPQLSAKAPRWTKLFHYRILNSDKARPLFKEMLRAADSATQGIIRKTLEEIATTESPPLSTRASFVLDTESG